MQKFKKLIPFAAALLPFVAFAADFTEILSSVTTWVGTLTQIAMAVAFLVFLFGVVKFIMSAGNEEARKTAKGYIIYGIIGLFAMVAVWGLVTVLKTSFGVTQTTIEKPQF